MDIIPGIVIRCGEDEDTCTVVLFNHGKTYKYHIPTEALAAIGADEMWACFVILNRNELKHIDECSHDIIALIEEEFRLVLEKPSLI